MVKKLFKNGYKRALTFSFDDGFAQDMRLVELFNKYSLKCTFNLEGGNCNNPCFRVMKDGIKLWDNSGRLRELYSGHEIASHSYTHKHMKELSDRECKAEIDMDVQALYEAFGYKIRGFVAPYGQWDERVLNALKENGVCYNRTTKTKDDFNLPENFYDWHTNGHIYRFMFDEGKKLLSRFFETEEELPLMYIWGHSYEITDLDAWGFEKWQGLTDRWTHIENLFKSISSKSDVWYATNIEIYDYVTAMNSAKVSPTYIDNPSQTELFFEVDGKLITAPAHSRFAI